AAYRYTEARLSRISGEMLADLDKNVVDFRPNFDNRKKEPVVLPSRFPNLLVNGSMGIAVGMATNIPPHNLGEVIDGTIYLMENPDATSADLVQYIKGPDFPTGAIIYGSAGIYDAYQTGRGRICVRSRAEIEEKHHRIIFTEIPYGVNKSMLIESIANLVKDKRIDGITGLRDESGRHGMRIVVEYRRDTNPQVLLNQLYKYTQLQDTCAVNMLALVDGVPKVLGLKEILTHYIKFQEDVVRRRVEFDLDRARREAHIYEGYKIAIDNIDEVVSIIRSSSSIPDARTALSERFGLTEVQAQAIVEMTLGRLTGLERQKVEERLLRLYETIKEYEAILADEERIKGIIKEELLEIKRKYADPRMTEIVPVEDEIILEDLIERHRCVITVTHEGYIKRQRADVYTTQRRGGVGVVAMSTKEEDFIEKVMAVGSHSYLLMFTNTGRVYIRKAYQIPESGRASRGSNIVNILELQEGEAVTAFIAAEDFAPEKYLIMVTKRGIVKRTALSEFKYQRRGGKIAITFNEGDELVFVRCTDGTCDIIIATDSGRAVRFSEKAVPVHGRTARGVRGIKITDGGRVVGVAVIEKNDERSLLTVTENGYGKRTDFSLFDRKNRGGMGVLCHGINEKTGPLAGIASVGDGDDVMLITTEGVMIRTPVSEINKYGRTASGVIVMRIRDENTKIASITCIPEKEENETSAGEGDGEKSERQGKSDYT
ncbi:MAG TPA: DNA gyrase subunit A, partial [Bacillota bacterium]|nr:DNA gyrase subunit A [Bacillota bacterium]